MKALFIGGSGNISTACSRLAAEKGIDLFLFNRGRRKVDLPRGVRQIIGDFANPAEMKKALAGYRFDLVVNYIVFETAQAAQDIEMFEGQVKQYVFISTATVYEKPPRHYVITEDVPLDNPFWEYAQKKIAIENMFMRAHRERGFPVTIVRPSFTYGDEYIPTPVSIDYTPVARLKKGLPLVVHGDGTSLWVMTHASDFAEGLVGLLGLESAIGGGVHITSDEALTWNQVHETIAKVVGVEPKLVHIPSEFIARINPRIGAGLLGDKAHSMVFDNSKIKRLVPDFRCTVPFEQGIARTIAYLEAHPEARKTNADTATEEILRSWQQAMAASS
jgi:nucleoside-diphosphate-sugar epimerase